MIYLIGGYIWLYLHRPFEFWTSLGDIRLERIYMIVTMLAWVFYPGKGWASNRLNKALLFFTVSILLCWFTSPRLFPSELGEKVFEEHCKVGVLFIIIVTTVDTEKKLKQLLGFYFLGLFLFQAHSFLEFLNGRYEFRQGIMRMNAVNKTHGDPNTFSATLLHALPFLVPFWMTVRLVQVKPLIVMHVVLTLLCIYLTGSRRAYVGIAFLSFLLMMRSERRWTLVGLSMLLVPAVFCLMRDDLQERLLSVFSSDSMNAHAVSSARFRLAALSFGWDIWMNHFLTGAGPSTFALASGTGLQAHNLYAQTMSEMGLLGIISLSALSVCFFLNARDIGRLYKQHPWWEKDFTYHVGTTATVFAVVLLLFMGTAGHNLFRYNWIWFGAFQICARRVAQKRAESEIAYNWEPSPAVGYRYAPQSA
jgi:O-antigen ligase